MFKKTFILLSPAKNNFIKNIALPSCNNCRYFVPNKVILCSDNYNDGYEEPKTENIYYKSTCSKFGFKDLISGEINYEYAVICRSNEKQCGLKGKYYIKENK